MKRLMKSVLACLLLLTLALLCSINICAGPFGAERVSSLTLHYGKGEESFGGLVIKTYRIAEIGEDGGYRLCGRFADHPVNVHTVSSQTEWKKITSTLAAYIAADKLSPDLEGTTDENGNVSFTGISTGLSTGLYLTLSVKRESAELVTVFEDFITAIPGRNAEGSYDYDVRANPKCESFVPAPIEVDFKVVKQWKDTGAEGKRPTAVEVDIIREGVTVESVKLSAENDWCYRWKAPDDKSAWYAVERNIPEGYKVTVSSDGRTIVITNSYEAPQPPPDTGDTERLPFYTLMLCLSGLALITLGVLRMRFEK